MLTKRLSSLAHRHPALLRALRPALALRSRLMQPSSDQVIDRLSHLLTEDPVLLVSEFEGQFAIAPRSHLFKRVVVNGEYEPILTRKCLELIDPRRDVIDIGANIGFHTVLIAKHLGVGRVLSVEPTKNALSRLRRNIKINSVENKVTIFAGVVAATSGWLEIKTISGLEEYSSLGELEHPSIVGNPYDIERVEARTLDQIVGEFSLNPGLIKVDVEGMEHLVFQGGQETLKRYRPAIVSELSDHLLKRNGSSAQAVVRSLEELNYSVIDPLHPNEKPGFRDFGDVICIPR